MNDANESHGDNRPSPSRASSTVVVFTGGDPMRRDVAQLLPDDAFVIAADSGLHTALALDRSVDLVIGDFDSVTPEALAAATVDGATIERHPIAKDQTDLELALDRALEMAPARILMVGGHGGRLDHFLANVLLLSSERYAGATIEAYMGDGHISVVRDMVELRGHSGDPLTLLPAQGPVHGVITAGLLYPLHGETLHAGSTRGVSNEFLANHASVRVEDGVLLRGGAEIPYREHPQMTEMPVHPIHQATCFHRSRVFVVFALVAVLATVGGACGASGRNDDASTSASSTTPEEALAGTTLRVVTHDSFNVSDDVIQAFEQQTGITVDLVKGGDAVEVVNQAILTRDNPQGDVLFGIDNNLLTRANDANLFEPYESPGLANVDAQYQLDPDHRVTPIDRGDVCLNFDREYFASHQLAVPQSLEDLTKPEYKGLLVVENPSTSTPGLAFLLATVAQFGPDGWQDYWRQLKDNGVTVSEGWEQAYYDLFSGGSGGGSSPLVVSYASSPPVEVQDISTPADQSPTGAIASSCYRQIEFAGVLAGTEHEAAAHAFIDFLLSVPFQNDMPLNMYVYPVNDQATLPEAFTKYSVTVDQPLMLSSDDVGANRDNWVEQWTQIFGT